MPAAISAAIAAIGIAGMAFTFVSASKIPEGNGIGMRSAAAAYRAGATITPTAPGPASPSGSMMADDGKRQDL